MDTSPQYLYAEPERQVGTGRGVGLQKEIIFKRFFLKVLLIFFRKSQSLLITIIGRKFLQNKNLNFFRLFSIFFSKNGRGFV